MKKFYYYILIITTFKSIFIHLTKLTNNLFHTSCHINSPRRIRNLDQQTIMLMNKNSKPCCLPNKWKSNFYVKTIKGGRYFSRLDYGTFYIEEQFNNKSNNALLIIGRNIYSTEFCNFNYTDHSILIKHLCPNDTIKCLERPFLGEPRCITEKYGYILKKSRLYNDKEKIKEIWFIDKYNEIFDYIERHLYHIIRQYGLCQLIRYQIQWGKYTMPWKNCRLFIKREQTYIPISGTFQHQFNQSFIDNLLFC
ncbi:unnamed protein product [Schistosoma rodhaini]|uniref:Uncharacterized protein n=1 Tax=Schistosoma rodhaini TaxID=6188 RepID=A0A183QQ71_9TREM|nr:unnamed protein product [Schistosoma rodhaini]CAH8572151.1 unnamed protein product [Schistosoma rodhaini]